jgi:hypothetical protein
MISEVNQLLTRGNHWNNHDFWEKTSRFHQELTESGKWILQKNAGLVKQLGKATVVFYSLGYKPLCSWKGPIDVWVRCMEYMESPAVHSKIAGNSGNCQPPKIWNTPVLSISTCEIWRMTIMMVIVIVIVMVMMMMMKDNGGDVQQQKC